MVLCKEVNPHVHKGNESNGAHDTLAWSERAMLCHAGAATPTTAAQAKPPASRSGAGLPQHGDPASGHSRCVICEPEVAPGVDGRRAPDE